MRNWIIRNIERWNLLVTGVLVATVVVVLFGAVKFPAYSWRFGWGSGISSAYWFHGWGLYPYDWRLYRFLVVWGTAGVPVNIAASWAVLSLAGGGVYGKRELRLLAFEGGLWLVMAAMWVMVALQGARE